MNKSINIAFLIAATLLLASCGQGGFTTMNASTKRAEPVYTPPAPILKQVGDFSVVQGATRSQNVTVNFDPATNTMKLKGILKLYEYGTTSELSLDLNLQGTGSFGDDTIILKNALQAASLPPGVEVAAKATCMGAGQSCTSSFVDLFVQYKGHYYHHQVETKAPVELPADSQGDSKEEPKNDSGETPSKPDQPKPVKPKPQAPSVDPKKQEPPNAQGDEDDHEHDEDPEAVKGNYQGDLQGDIEELFPKNDAPKDPPKGKPVLTPNLQSFGAVDNGELKNGINLLAYLKTHDGTGFYLLHPNDRKTYFGNSELVLMIRLLGRHTLVYVPSHRLGISDMSAENGGKLVRHSSHQMGADVDITYFISNDTRPKVFEKQVDGKGNVSPNLMLKDQWRLFKYAVSSQWVDRIFVHPSIKKALCQLAEKEGETKSDKQMFGAIETLRRLRPESNHGDHFHLRVKMRCLKGDRRCQPMGPPPTGTSCDKV